ncbi:MAG TPA: hypothetical protein VK947_01565 [Planococcus sp. (in: firmicutes)]|nr:hypothetical protein [Planococcus sp. (in: firmicutes)]
MKKLMMTLILVPTLLAGCGADATSSGIETRINDELGVDAHVPQTFDYPIGIASIEYGFHMEDGDVVLDDPFFANIQYQLATEEPFEGIDREAWEEEHRSEIIYGDFYQEPSVVSMRISKDSFGSIIDAGTQTISGHVVQYQFLQRDANDIVIIGFDIENVGYLLNYQLIDGQTEEDAQAFASEIIEYYQ